MDSAIKQVTMRIMCRDGTHFELPSVPEMDILNFMCGVKASGFVGHVNFFVPYESILWVSRVEYRHTASMPEGMLRQ